MDEIDAILKFVDAINRRDVSGLGRLMTGNHVFIDYGGGQVSGREKMLEAWREYFRLYPDYMIHVQNVLCSGSDAVAVTGTVTGSHLGPEEESRTTFIWTARIADGLVSEWRIYR